MKFCLSLFAAALSLILGASPSVEAQGLLSFSGGNGNPLVMTLAQPVTYTITIASGSAPYFFFDGVGANTPGSMSSRGVTGNITFSINGGAPQSIFSSGDGFNLGDVTPDDLFITGFTGTVSPGNLITLSAGTLTTTASFAQPPPASGSFTTFITNQNGQRLSLDGVAQVPEPSTWQIALGGIGLLLLMRQCSRLQIRKAA